MIDAPLRTPRTYVRREGRITRAQRRALNELWPRYGLEANAGVLDFAHHFGRRAPLILEIGFGNGEALLELAERDPATNCLGIEVYRPGIGHLLLQLAARGIDNVRVIEGDAREVLARVPPRSLHAVYLLFPDPWPKKRHHKRRLLQAPFLELLRSRLEAGGRVHIATDWEDYARCVRSAVTGIPGLVAVRHHGRGLAIARPTRFERRGRALGHRIWRIVLERVL